MASPDDILSLPARLLCWLVLPCAFTALLITSAPTALLSVVVSLPPAWLLRERTKLEPAKQGDLETLIWTFFATGTLGIAMIMAIQAALNHAAAWMLFGARAKEFLDDFGRSTVDGLSPTDVERRARTARSWRYRVFLILLAYGMAGLLEESMKYFVVLSIRRFRPSLGEHEYLAYVVACGLGFSTSENIAFVLTMLRSGSKAKTALTVVERMLLGTPGHSLMGCLTMVNVIRRDVRGEGPASLWRVLAPAVAYHGTFDLALMGMSAAEGNVGWIHPTRSSTLVTMVSVAGGMLAMLVLHVRHNVAALGL